MEIRCKEDPGKVVRSQSGKTVSWQGVEVVWWFSGQAERCSGQKDSAVTGDGVGAGWIYGVRWGYNFDHTKDPCEKLTLILRHH